MNHTITYTHMMALQSDNQAMSLLVVCVCSLIFVPFLSYLSGETVQKCVLEWFTKWRGDCFVIIFSVYFDAICSIHNDGFLFPFPAGTCIWHVGYTSYVNSLSLLIAFAAFF